MKDELESIKYIKKTRELINLGSDINFKARLIHLERMIIEDIENLQPVTTELIEPSEEEIEKWAHDKSVDNLSGTNYTAIVIEMNELAMKAAITGAKWAISEIKKLNLK